MIYFSSVSPGMWLCYMLKFTCTVIFVAMEVGFLSTIVSSFMFIFKLYCAGGVKPEGHTDSHDVIDMRLVIITWSYYRHRKTILNGGSILLNSLLQSYTSYIFTFTILCSLLLYISLFSELGLSLIEGELILNVILVITRYFFLKLPAAAI